VVLKKASAFFYRISNGWVVLAALIILLMFSGFTLPVESKRVDAYSQGLGSPDNSLFYSGKMLLQMAEAYGEAGRSAFLHARWGFDLAFPLIYTFFFITSISFIFKMGAGKKGNLPLLNLIPLLGLFFDLAENTATSVVMAAYPVQGTWGQVLAPIFTPLKWFFVTISVLLLLIGVIIVFVKKIINRTSK
jgi:hypothetical protein